MIKPDLDKTLERFQCWREFLLLSEKYEELCDFVEKKKNDYPWMHPFISHWCPTEKMLDHPYFDWKNTTFTESELSIIYDEENGTTYDNILTSLYPLFQNIFEKDFSDVKVRVTHFWETADFENDLPFISPASSDICQIISKHPAFHPSKMDEQISTRDLYFSLMDHIRSEAPKHNMISIKSLGYGKEEIKKEFNHYLMNSLDLKVFPQKQIPYRWELYLTNKKCNLVKLKQMLACLDLKKRLPRKKAIEATFPKATDSRDERVKENNFDQFIRQAKRVIKNAESGEFPGEYGK